jgi:hypothetical protein
LSFLKAEALLVIGVFAGAVLMISSIVFYADRHELITPMGDRVDF